MPEPIATYDRTAMRTHRPISRSTRGVTRARHYEEKKTTKRTHLKVSLQAENLRPGGVRPFRPTTQIPGARLPKLAPVTPSKTRTHCTISPAKIAQTESIAVHEWPRRWRPRLGPHWICPTTFRVRDTSAGFHRRAGRCSAER